MARTRDEGRLRTAQERRALLLSAYYKHLNGYAPFRDELERLKIPRTSAAGHSRPARPSRDLVRFVKRWDLSVESIDHILTSLRQIRAVGAKSRLSAVGGDRVLASSVHFIQPSSFAYTPVMTHQEARREVGRIARSMVTQLLAAERDWTRSGWAPLPARFRDPIAREKLAGRLFRYVRLGEDWKVIAAAEDMSVSSLRRHAVAFAAAAGLPKPRLHSSP